MIQWNINKIINLLQSDSWVVNIQNGYGDYNTNTIVIGILENPDNAEKMGCEVTKIDTLGNGFYRVYYK